MKILIRLILLMVPVIIVAQAPESHQKSFYQDEDGKLFWNRYLPFYLNISSSPDEKGTDLFMLHEGTKVSLIGKEGDWMEIRLSDGNEGWAELRHIEII